jgi:hypothetical protein
MGFSLQCSSVNFCQHFLNLSHETCSPFNVGLKPADSLEGFGDEAVHVDHDGRVVHGGRLHSCLPLFEQSLVLEQKISSHSFFKYFFWGGFLIFFVLYSTLLHLPPLRLHRADGCWYRTQDRCSWCIGSMLIY